MVFHLKKINSVPKRKYKHKIYDNNNNVCVSIFLLPRFKDQVIFMVKMGDKCGALSHGQF